MKKFLQKSSAWLVMLVAWFAVSMSAMAQDDVTVTFQYDDDAVYYNGGASYTGETIDGVTVSATTFVQRNDWGPAGIYADRNATMTIESATEIKSITITNAAYCYGSYYANNWSFTNVDSYTGAGTATLVITPVPGSTTVGINFNWSGSNITKMTVVRSGETAPTEDIDYTLTVNGEIPVGASVTLDGEPFTESGVHTVMANLSLRDLEVVCPDEYYVETSYDKESLTFTVEFKHWYIYNIVTNNANGATGVSEWKYNGEQIKSKTSIPSNYFEAKEVNGFNGEVSVDKVDDYTYTVTVTYTQKEDVPYYIVFPEGTPSGTKVIVNDDQEFTASGTYLTPYDLTYNDFAVAVPEGYWSANTWNCYVAASRTFTVEVHEYLHYNVVVEGTDDANAGVVYNYTTYYAGAVINSQYEISLSSVKAANVAGLEGTVTLEGTTFKVTYTKPEYIVIDTTTGKIDNSYWTLEGSGVTVQGSGTPLNIWYYAWGANWTATVMSNTFAIEKIEFIDRDGDTMYCDVNCGSFSNNIWTCDGGEYYSVTFDPNGGGYYNDGDYYISSVRVWLKQSDPVEPTPAPEFPVEGVAYQIGLYNSVIYPAGGYLNVVTTNGNNGTIRADEAEPLYFTWDGAEGAFYIQDEEGNYIGGATGSNTWSCMPSVKEYWTVETISEGVYAFKSKTSGYLGFNTNTNGAFRDMQKGGYKTESGYYHEYSFTIEEYTVAPVAVATFNMSAAGWATLCINEAFTVPAGYTAYVAGKDVNGEAVLVEDGKIVLTEITDVPAGVGVILQGPAANGIEVFAPAETPAAPEVNFLLGNSTDEVQDWWTSAIVANYVPGDYMKYDQFGSCQLYQLANEGGKVGFYRQTEDGSTLSCGAHKAFLVVPNEVAASNARLLFPGQSEPTGIDTVLSTEAAEAIYNLQGQRVNAAKGGVYVKNGKKIIVK